MSYAGIGAKIVDKRSWEARVEMAVFKRPSNELSTYDKLIYAIMCGHANREGNATLYVRTIAAEASCSERQVQRALSNLAAHGLLIRKPQYHNGRQTFNIYEVYGSDSYISGDISSAPAPESAQEANPESTPVTDSRGAQDRHRCSPDVQRVQDRHRTSACESGFNNVLEQPLKNSSKKEHSPPTPQGAGGRHGGNAENSKAPKPNHVTEEKGKSSETRDTRETPCLPEAPPPKTPSQISHKVILDAYNELLPKLPHAEAITASRGQTLNLRINEDSARREPEWWRKYFRRVRTFPWLMGHNPNGWRASFDWLTSEDGMRKVIEGVFSQAQPYQEYTREELIAWQQRYTDEGGNVDAKALLRDWREKTGRTSDSPGIFGTSRGY